MLNDGVLVLILLNFSLIGLLPVIFFKKGGRLNLMWWLTAAPLILTPIFLMSAYFGYGLIPQMSAIVGPVSRWLGLAAVPISAASIALIALTIGTHRIPIALWHQKDDAAEEIVEWGAYKRIRHPFYSSFLLAFLAALIFCPHPVTAFMFVAALLQLNLTAAREERRLSESPMGDKYKSYMARTGRFLPRWGKS